MEHKLITGGEQFLPFARSRIKALRAMGLQYASQQFEVDGCSIKVRIEPGQDYIRLAGGKGVIAYTQDVRFPETEKVTSQILGGKVKLRRGHYANSIYTGACSVSPFSNKNITATVTTGTGTDWVVFDGFAVFRKTLTVSIGGVVVSTVDVSGHNVYVVAASSLHDSAAVVVSSYVNVGTNSGMLNSITAYSAEYVYDAAGLKLTDSGGEPTLTCKKSDFPDVPSGRLDASLNDLPPPVLSDAGALIVLTQRAAAFLSDNDYRFTLRVLYGAGPACTAPDVFTLMRNPADGGPPGILFTAVSGSTVYVGYFYFVGSIRNNAIAVIQMKKEPFSATLVKTMELGPSPAGFTYMHNATVTAVKGFLWGMTVCYNSQAGVLTYLPTPLKVPPNYIAVSADGKTATYYWTTFSMANIALAGVDLSNPSFSRSPALWPTNIGSTPYNLDFSDGSSTTYQLSIAPDGTHSIADISPSDVSLKTIPGSSYHHTPTAPFPGSALQFKKP